MKEFLSQQGLEYIEVDVSSDPQARKDFMAKGYRGVPVTEIGGEVVIGFDVKRLEDAVSSP
ncbi:MAG: glutaredoxin family protein [Firmicutes bacterium]|nr:glutaredoxin family protein [Bacillota bacterium]